MFGSINAKRLQILIQVNVIEIFTSEICIKFIGMETKNKKNNTLEIGDSLPSFSLMDQEGLVWDSKTRLAGKISIIYFYPKDESGICTEEACAFRDNFTAFTDAGIQVVGINSANIESHKKFAKNNNLPFTLLSDTNNRVLKQFGVRNALFLTGRETFIFDADGKLLYKFRNFFKGDDHVSKTLAFLGIKP